MHIANVNKKKKKSALISQGNIRQHIELQHEPQQRRRLSDVCTFRKFPPDETRTFLLASF